MTIHKKEAAQMTPNAKLITTPSRRKMDIRVEMKKPRARFKENPLRVNGYI